MPATAIPRPEYPRPQFERADWINLNGVWTFAFDFGLSGEHAGRSLASSRGFEREILVPFCPESALSGVEYRDFIPCLWYHRKWTVPEGWKSRRILLHFGGVDYASEVFIDGRSAGRHEGGTVSFCHDVTAFVTPGREHDLVVRAADDLRSGLQPAGKQCPVFRSRGCHYTRTTGIWQTVWAEAVAPCGLKAVHLVPDLDGAAFAITPEYHAARRGLTLRAAIQDEAGANAEIEVPAAPGVPFRLPAPGARAWSPHDPHLYRFLFQVRDGAAVLDEVRSYGGLRKVHIEGDQLFLNNEPLFLRFVLDQGFYPDGIWTAPSDAALKRDIELALQAGFNGARLHQKVFEERFHYWADRLGYLTWGESASWGCSPSNPAAAQRFLSEWREIVVRDRNHPSLIAWTPWNETGNIADAAQHRRTQIESYELTKALDPTRPVNDASGFTHVRTDLWTVHNYEQNPAALKRLLTPTPERGVWRNLPERDAPYAGQPYLIDEFGGIRWIPPARQPFADDSWGYGDAPRSLAEFYERLEGLVDAILSQPHVRGFCYTQLTDVEQEQNGIYQYDRSAKFDPARLARIFRQPPPAPAAAERAEIAN